MSVRKNKIFAPSKVGIYHEKIINYLNGEKIFPTTIELDLTQLCTRNCASCPYLSSRKPGLTLQLPFLDRLFGILGPNTPGIVLSGGEPTLVPHFPEVVSTAKRRGFKDVAVISNGTRIHLKEVQDALLENVTSIRISLYDWEEEETESFVSTLKGIEYLKNKIEREGSKLELGVSMLTRKERNHRYETVGRQVLNTGIDWLYFHPFCINWDKEMPVQADQSEVIETLEKFMQNAPEDANIQIPYGRYLEAPLVFEKMHGSFFLIQVGADGVNYVGPECKYEPDATLLDLNEYLEDDFLWHPKRIQKLNQINSNNYRFIGTKHRPPVFSDYIQKIIDSSKKDTGSDFLKNSADEFRYPNII